MIKHGKEADVWKASIILVFDEWKVSFDNSLPTLREEKTTIFKKRWLDFGIIYGW